MMGNMKLRDRLHRASFGDPVDVNPHTRELLREAVDALEPAAPTDLGFRLELRGDVWVVQYDTGGCHPANPDEIKLWLALEAADVSADGSDTPS